MNILVACEFSAVVRDAFRARGHNAWSCDLLPTEGDPRWHYQMPIEKVLAVDLPWDMLLAFPDCTYLCSSGIHWNTRNPARAGLTDAAADFFLMLARCWVPRIAIENPIGVMSTRYRRPDQIIQPHQFGADASKATCLWLHNLPALTPTRLIEPRWIEGKRRWANQTDSGQNKLGPSSDRARNRSRTYPGVAEAMADQWGALPPLTRGID